MKTRFNTLTPGEKFTLLEPRLNPTVIYEILPKDTVFAGKIKNVSQQRPDKPEPMYLSIMDNPVVYTVEASAVPIGKVSPAEALRALDVNLGVH